MKTWSVAFSVALACATSACGPDHAKVCAHYAEVALTELAPISSIAGKKVEEQDRAHFTARCVAGAGLRKSAGWRRWRCESACMTEAKTLAGMAECEAQCGPDPEPALRSPELPGTCPFTHLAFETEKGLQELRIGSDEKVEVFPEPQQAWVVRAAMLPSRPELCAVRVDKERSAEAPRTLRSLTWSDPTKPSEAPRKVDLGDEDPSAILAMGERCLVAFEGKVELFDFKAQPPARKTIHSYKMPSPKPIDAFAWDGRVVVGVDDWVMPKFAFVYDLEADGSLRLRYDAKLASSGRYDDAFLADRWLVATTVSSHRGGEDLAVELYRVGSSELRPAGSAMESKDSQTDRASLLGGSEFTPWLGAAVFGDRVLICASKRGVLSLPLALPKDAKADVLDVGGRCDDLLVVGDRVHVFSSPGVRQPGKLRSFRMSEGRLSRVLEHDLGVWARGMLHPSSHLRNLP